jgi:LDH2 family malate/lactate/ureidoglycolate dehydrogenase
MMSTELSKGAPVSGAITVPAERVEALLTEIFLAAGTPPEIAPVPAEHLVLANLSGYDSHGVLHITHYMDEIDSGVLVPSARPEVIADRPGSLVVDARHGWGHHAAVFALELAMERARATGVAAASLRNCPHIGRLGHYVELAARAGFISMVTWGSGKPATWGPPRMGYHLTVPYGGAAPTLSTNPFAFGAPTGDDRPFVADFATTVIANAKTWIYAERGEELPPGVALDRDGVPTVDPVAYLDGGSLLTFGAHKGYGISLITCLLGGLTGSFGGADQIMDGPFLWVLDPAAFTEPVAYTAAVRSFLDGMNETPPAAGFDEVLVPGDYEARSRARLAATGLELSASVVAALESAARRLGVPCDLTESSAIVG